MGKETVSYDPNVDTFEKKKWVLLIISWGNWCHPALALETWPRDRPAIEVGDGTFAVPVTAVPLEVTTS